MITVDEEANISACIASLAGLVDGILVYDTGSTDSTVNIARANGARVVTGYWDNSFAAARNRALRLCRAEWILSIDADETVEYPDADGIRKLLEKEKSVHMTEYFSETMQGGTGHADSCYNKPVDHRRPPSNKGEHPETRVDAFEVGIHNILAFSTSGESWEWRDLPRVTHPAIRLFRRDIAMWEGRVHESITSKVAGRRLMTVSTPVFCIIHSGYAISRELSSSKAKRNLELAELEIDGDGKKGKGVQTGSTTALALLKSGKARWAVRDLHGALRDLLRAADADDRHDTIAWMALKSALQVAIWLDDTGKTLALHTRMGAEFPVFPSIAEGLPVDILSFIVACIRRDHAMCRTIATSFDPPARKLLIAQALNIGPHIADCLLEESYQVFDSQDDLQAIVAVSSVIAPKLGIETATRWSRRIRASGVPELCPLMAIAKNPHDTVPVRIAAARIAAHEFSDQEAQCLLQSIR
ncbi:MAG: glycosyltransferase [Actinobacteria bacterium]|nr:glycosyltransferase [Actinomycetota bacterium]